MRAVSVVKANRANFVTADRCGNRRRALRLNASVMQVSRGLFPLKTALHLSEITGNSLRNCEYWLSEKAVIPSDALTALLHSEWGRDFLAAVMADSTPRWWLKLKAWMASVDLAAAEMKQRRKLRELLNDAAQTSHPYSAFISDHDFAAGQPYPPAPMAPRRRR